MQFTLNRRSLCLVMSLLLSACAAEQLALAPNTNADAQLKAEYLVGKWCNNRNLTADANTATGQSAVANLATKFWSFKLTGRWDNSESGWFFAEYGSWQLQGRNDLVLDPKRGDPITYRANFRSSGIDLHLEDEAGLFLVLSRCD